ncbi:kinase-like domain-containing protein [Morchella snyderi]|nr:kinase-like domain-containing protein [Morchella snyderi]
MRFKRIGTDIVHETTVDGEIVSETWNKGTLLGAGGQGKVYKQESKTNPSQFRAVKEISSISINAKYKPAREIDTLLSVKDEQHSNLFVDFFGWYEDDESIYIVMEYIPHGDLSVYVKNHRELAQKEAKTITRQILEGLHVLHDMKICHRDLKPPVNVLVAGINPLHLKLADFGISKDTARSELRTRSGTQRYMAPELQGLKVQHGAKRSTTYTLAVDMWALGVIVYELLTSRHPFQENTTFHEPITSCPGANNQAQSHIGEIDQFLFLYFCKGDAPLRIFPAPHMSERASDFIKKVLVADAERRMSAAAALEHEWISGNE